MAPSHDVMTDEQRESVALEYLKAFDNGDVSDLVVVEGTSHGEHQRGTVRGAQG